MAKRKRRFNFLKFIVFILIIYLIFHLIVYLFNIKTHNIIILNNNYYNDEVIIETAKVEKYPKFLLLNKNKIKKRLLKLDLIDSVEVKKKFGYILEISINEKKILYLNKEKNKYVLSDGQLYDIDNIYGIPILINYIPEEIETKFINEFKLLDKNIISKISEIEYSKTSYDEERFHLYMNDQNEVYINIEKLNNLNKYISIVKKLDNKKGILYLDSGNYFEIKE